jgi:uncharacterized membrane protein YphA (DoxX/SURF4 family)
MASASRNIVAVQRRSGMKIAATAARVLLGVLFVVMGLNGFLLFMPPPPTGIPPTAAAFSGAMFTSHFMWMTSGVQLLAGVLLLANRAVFFALIVLAALLVNILTFHITMWPQSLVPLPIIAVILWFIAAWPLRREFFRLFSTVPEE